MVFSACFVYIQHSATALSVSRKQILWHLVLVCCPSNVLRILEATPNGKNTISIVSRIMLVSGANMTGVAKRLEKNGFLIRRGDANDERIKILEITPKGKETLKNIYHEKNEVLKKYMSGVSIDEKEEMLSRLRQIKRRVK